MQHVAAATPLNARVVTIIDLTREDRRLQLEPWTSRVIRCGEIHELITTDETSSRNSSVVDKVAYLAFVEFTHGGVIFVGDVLRHGDSAFGYIRGFDYTHMPNHMNIVVQVSERATGAELCWRLGDRMEFVRSEHG